MGERRKDTQPGLGELGAKAPQDAPSSRRPTARGLGSAPPPPAKRDGDDTAPDPVAVVFMRQENDSLDEMLDAFDRKRIPVPRSFEAGRVEEHAARTPRAPGEAAIESPVIVDVTTEMTEPPAAVREVRERHDVTYVPPRRSTRALWLAVALGAAVVCVLAAVFAWPSASHVAPSVAASSSVVPAIAALSATITTPVASPPIAPTAAPSTTAESVQPTAPTPSAAPAPTPRAPKPTPKPQDAKTGAASDHDLLEH